MKQMDTIVVPSTFGQLSDDAVNTAMIVAKRFQAKVLLLHVIPDKVYPWAADKPGIPELERRLLRRYAQDEVLGGLDVEVIIEKGSSPASVICDTGVLHNADLIVMGSRVSAAEVDMRLGATAERVIRKATTPVWVVRPGTPQLPRHILCPVDGSDASRRALRNAHHLSRRFQAKLTVLNVLEPLTAGYSGIVMLGEGVESGFLTPQRQQFENFISQLEFRDTSWIRKAREGRPHEQILAEIEETDVDLLVMGTIGKTGVTRFLIGSVTEKVARQLPCSILTMKAREMIHLRLDAALESLNESLCRGRDLLEDGYASQAITEFDRCLVASPTLVAAWDGKAKAYDQLGDSSGADQARENARRIRQRLLREIPED